MFLLSDLNLTNNKQTNKTDLANAERVDGEQEEQGAPNVGAHVAEGAGHLEAVAERGVGGGGDEEQEAGGGGGEVEQAVVEGRVGGGEQGAEAGEEGRGGRGRRVQAEQSRVLVDHADDLLEAWSGHTQLRLVKRTKN